MDGLHHNGLDYYTHLLTGYIGSAGFLKYIAEVVKHLRQVNPDLIYGKNGFTFVKCRWAIHFLLYN
jgi:pyridoxal/pyridoxine/pyridoxamine kinase